MAFQFVLDMYKFLLEILADIDWGGSTPRLIKPRAPRQRDDSKPSLNNLGDYLIMIIFEQVCLESPRSMNNLALVSSHYYHIARYCRHREISLNISESNKDWLQKQLAYIVKSGLSSAVRRINMRGHEDQENVEAVLQFLQKTTGLRDLEWLNDGPPISSIGVPEKVIVALRPRKLVRLHASLKQETIQINKPVPKFISPLQIGCENLYSLRMCLSFSPDTASGMIQILKRILLSSPNVRRLAINQGNRRRGCDPRPHLGYFGLGFVDGERSPALEELELHKYVFGTHGQLGVESVRYTHSGERCPGREEEDYWVETFDWSRLRKLRTDERDFALKLAPKLISLDEASFTECPEDTDDSYPRKFFREFYGAVANAPSTVILPTFSSLGVDGIIEQASKLKVLRIHRHQSVGWAARTIDAPSLHKIQEECPLIEELVLDIKRQDDWPYEILDILAGFRKLRSLTIWFELLQDGRTNGDFIRPHLTYFAAEKLFIYIRSRRPSSFLPLKKLKLHCGTKRWRGDLLQGRWPRSNVSTYVCQPSENCDEAADGMFTITCLELKKHENAILERMRCNGEAAPADLSTGLRIAINGPMILDELDED
ncbi:unnamed protein product [Clonostachys rosea]|uniref:F-box domain-containing protein n=1 Tax=Bionectria ochroleuca TaxID=29856 RepID=A0ABY6U0F8_BIOOC|nr:unnamed protein product [Clonostachys rosea]